MNKPRLAFFVGDPNGIGPELAAKLLARPQIEKAEVTVFGDARLLPRYLKFEAVPGLDDAALTPGRANAAAGRWVIDALKRMARAAREGQVDGVESNVIGKNAANVVPLSNTFELAARMAANR